MLRTSAGSSFTIVRPATWWPAAVSRSAMARPLASVASVRVSLTVTTKQRTDARRLRLVLESLREDMPTIVTSSRICERARLAQARKGVERRRESAMSRIRISAASCS